MPWTGWMIYADNHSFIIIMIFFFFLFNIFVCGLNEYDNANYWLLYYLYGFVFNSSGVNRLGAFC